MKNKQINNDLIQKDILVQGGIAADRLAKDIEFVPIELRPDIEAVLMAFQTTLQQNFMMMKFLTKQQIKDIKSKEFTL